LQKGAIDRFIIFIINKTQVSSDNQSLDPRSLAIDIIAAYDDVRDDHTKTKNMIVLC
jgi:hypothetical protein